METWAIVVLVVGTNVGTALLALIGIKKELEHSDKRLEKQLKAVREEDQHRRKREVRDEHLVNLRDELACMGEKSRTSVGLATQVTDEVTKRSDKIIKDLDKAKKEWDAYIKSGKFLRAINMQYDEDMKLEAFDIMMDYQRAYRGIEDAWSGGKKKKDEAVSEAIDILKENDVRVSKLQSEIIKRREEL